MRVRVTRVRSGTSAATSRFAIAARGTAAPAVPTGRSSTTGVIGAAVPRVVYVSSAVVVDGGATNDAARLPLVPASSPVRGRWEARIRSRPTGAYTMLHGSRVVSANIGTP